jgi:predicted ester cyclase
MALNKKEHIQYAVEQLVGQGNLEVIDVVFANDYVAHAENKKHKGKTFIKQFSQVLRASIPDIAVLKIEFFAEENNLITWQRTLKGTHQKNMMGIPASNKSVTWNEMVVSRFEGDKIAEEWVVSELMGQLLLQLGRK